MKKISFDKIYYDAAVKVVAETRPGKITFDTIIFAMNYLSYYGNVLDIGKGPKFV